MLKSLLFTMLKNFTMLKMFFKKSLLYTMLKSLLIRTYVSVR